MAELLWPRIDCNGCVGLWNKRLGGLCCVRWGCELYRDHGTVATNTDTTQTTNNCCVQQTFPDIGMEIVWNVKSDCFLAKYLWNTELHQSSCGDIVLINQFYNNRSELHHNISYFTTIGQKPSSFFLFFPTIYKSFRFTTICSNYII